MKSKYWTVKNALKSQGYTLERIEEYKGTRNGKSPQYQVYRTETKEPFYKRITLSVLYDRLVLDGIIPYETDED